MVVRSMLTKRRLDRIKANKVDIAEIIQWLCKVGVGGGKPKRETRSL